MQGTDPFLAISQAASWVTRVSISSTGDNPASHKKPQENFREADISHRLVRHISPRHASAGYHRSAGEKKIVDSIHRLALLKRTLPGIR